MRQKSDQTRLVLIPAGKTDWTGQDRLQGDADLPLSAEGIEQINEWVEQLKSLNINTIYSCRTDPPAATAKLIAKALKLKWRSDGNLAEVHLGLWQGMHRDEIKQKHPKVYKQWCERPDSVIPPEGESLKAARDRLEKSLAKLIKSNRARCVAVVLGEISLALARLDREHRDVAELGKLIKEPLTWHEYLIEYVEGRNAPSSDQEGGPESGSQ